MQTFTRQFYINEKTFALLSQILILAIGPINQNFTKIKKMPENIILHMRTKNYIT